MVAIALKEGSPGIPDVLLQAVARTAERHAELTAAYLDATGLFPKRPVFLPAPFLLELDAVLQLGMWERLGLREHLDADLPTFNEAAKQLARRAMKGVAEFTDPNASPLHLQVLKAWTENFAWEADKILGADVLVSPMANEDVFVEVLAEFVWQHRRELASMLNLKQ